MPTLRANAELVAVTWLKGVEGLGPGMVGTTLPKDVTTWAETGFVTVRVTGGAPGVYVPMRQSVLTVDTWALSPNSAKPPWGLANNLVELVEAGCRAPGAARNVTLPGEFPTARVEATWALSEPRRAYGDQGGYAHYVLDLQMAWVQL
jgi:hypothetical protein